MKKYSFYILFFPIYYMRARIEQHIKRNVKNEYTGDINTNNMCATRTIIILP